VFTNSTSIIGKVSIGTFLDMYIILPHRALEVILWRKRVFHQIRDN